MRGDRFFGIGKGLSACALSLVMLLLAAHSVTWARPPGDGGTPPTSVAPTQASCVIICPDSLQDQADMLSDFHTYTEEISSTVVTTESIDSSYTAVSDPPFDGYKNRKLPGWRNIKNYNYTLARKIIAYLKDTDAHPELVYVAILGDGLLVPPSYYYYYASGHGSYADWVPTDFFYTSPDYNFVPDFRVGRLSVSDTAEASAMVNKIINWYGIADWSWFKKAWIVGGDPYSTGPDPYLAERLETDLVNEGFFSGMDITKCHHSDGGKHAKDYVEPAIKDAGEGILFLMGHGNGKSVALMSDNTYLTADDLMTYPLNEKTPVVFISSCYATSYDVDLYARTYPHSFGEAMLKSKAGAIAVIGGSRNNEGISTYHLDKGNEVVDGWTEMAALFYYELQSYSNGPNPGEPLTIGKIVFDGFNGFQANNDISGSPASQQAAFQHCLLGDPALIIPVQQPAPSEYQKPVGTASGSVIYGDDDIPVYTATPITISVDTDAPMVKWRLLNGDTRTTLDNDPEGIDNKTYTTDVDAPGLYILRTAIPAGVASADYAKENWFYYRIASDFMHISNISMQEVARGKTKYAEATATIVDDSGSPVSGATVSGNWSGLTADTETGTTDTSGQVTFSSDKVDKSAVGIFTFCVDEVTLTGWAYDRDASVNCNSIDTPQQAAPELVETPSTALENAYPSPGNPDIWIPFTLSKAEHVVIRIYSSAAQLIRTLELGERGPGNYMSKEKAAYWDGKNEAGEPVASGVYFYIIQAGEYKAARKTLMLK